MTLRGDQGSHPEPAFPADVPVAGLSEVARESVLSEFGMCMFDEDVNDASMCLCGMPALGHDEAVWSIFERDHPAVARTLAAPTAQPAIPWDSLREPVAAAIATHWNYDRRDDKWCCDCGAELDGDANLDALQQAHIADAALATVRAEVEALGGGEG